MWENIRNVIQTKEITYIDCIGLKVKFIFIKFNVLEENPFFFVVVF